MPRWKERVEKRFPGGNIRTQRVPGIKSCRGNQKSTFLFSRQNIGHFLSKSIRFHEFLFVGLKEQLDSLLPSQTHRQGIKDNLHFSLPAFSKVQQQPPDNPYFVCYIYFGALTHSPCFPLTLLLRRMTFYLFTFPFPQGRRQRNKGDNSKKTKFRSEKYVCKLFPLGSRPLPSLLSKPTLPSSPPKGEDKNAINSSTLASSFQLLHTAQVSPSSQNLWGSTQFSSAVDTHIRVSEKKKGRSYSWHLFPTQESFSGKEKGGNGRSVTFELKVWYISLVSPYKEQ